MFFVPQSSPPTPGGDTQTPFAEWLAVMRPPDKDTINKHVTNMVTVGLLYAPTPSLMQFIIVIVIMLNSISGHVQELRS